MSFESASKWILLFVFLDRAQLAVSKFCARLNQPSANDSIMFAIQTYKDICPWFAIQILECYQSPHPPLSKTANDHYSQNIEPFLKCMLDTPETILKRHCILNSKQLLYLQHMQHFSSVGINIRTQHLSCQAWPFSLKVKFQFQSRNGWSSSCANLNPIFETYLFLSRCKLHFSY